MTNTSNTASPTLPAGNPLPGQIRLQDITQDVEANIKDQQSGDYLYAYTLGVQAYIYGFPWNYLSYLYWLWTTEGGEKLQQAGGVAEPVHINLNQFGNQPEPQTPENSTGGSPNCDFIYSLACLDLSKEPVVLRVPPVKDRYYVMEMFCMDSDNFAYVGSYATGSDAGDYLIAGPGWVGTVPDTVLNVLPQSRTYAAFILGRTKTDGSEADLKTAQDIQSKYQLVPLSLYPNFDSYTGTVNTDPHSPVNPTANTAGTWPTMNRAMTANPPGLLPGIDQTEMLALFATIGVGPNQSHQNQSDTTKLGLHRAAKDGLPLLKNLAQGRGKNVNGWTYPPLDIGEAGQNSDFVTRATLQALAGITANNPDEAVYINTYTDYNGDQLSGTRKYKFEFDENVKDMTFPNYDPTYFGYWSITMYQSSDYNLVQGSTHYNINSYEAQYAPVDGKLIVYLQAEEPDDLGPGVCWLQSPDEPFYLILRVYVPGPNISATQTYQPPRIMPNDLSI